MAALTLLSTAATAGPSASVRGPARIIDGDSLAIAGQSFDLAGVDAPELGQRCMKRQRLYDCGDLAQAALMDLTAGVEVECRTVSSRSGETTMPPLARCNAGGYDLSEGMIYTGWALLPPEPEVAMPKAFAVIQTRAEERQRGLWQGSFVVPWEWRQGVRLPEEPAE